MKINTKKIFYTLTSSIILTAVFYIVIVSKTVILASENQILKENVGKLENTVSTLDHEFIAKTEGLDMDKAFSMGYEKVIDNKVSFIKSNNNVALR